MKANIRASLALCAVLIVGCSTITKFDQNTLEAATRLKAASLSLLSHGSEPSTQYLAQIAALQSDLSAQLAYEKGKGAPNDITARQWQLLASPDHLLGKFLKDWAAGKTYSATFVQEELSLINDAFDQIVNLEGAKIR